MDSLRVSKFSNLLKKISHKGFVGPKYRGVAGKFRFALQHLVTHREYIYYFDRLFVNEPLLTDQKQFTIRCIKNYEEVTPYLELFESSYYSGYTKSWRRFFSFKEELILAFYQDKPVAFCWIQVGNARGGSYCLPYFKGDFRSFRAGVLPQERGHNYQALMNIAVTNYLLSERSAQRIFAEVYKDNVPSCKSYERAGFRVLGVIRVWSLFSNRHPFIRWEGNPPKK